MAYVGERIRGIVRSAPPERRLAGRHRVGRQCEDAAWHRAAADFAVVSHQGETVRAAADIASNGAREVRAAKLTALEAIAAAEVDGFRVGENLSVTDTRRIDVSTMAARHTAATEHAENIRWHAEQLLATDTLIGQRLTAKATELNGIRFDGEGDGDFPTDGIVQPVDFKQWPVFDDDKPWEYNLDLTTDVFLDALASRAREPSRASTTCGKS